MKDFYTLMDELIKEKLEKNKEYMNLKEKLTKLNELEENAYHEYLDDPESDYPYLSILTDKEIDSYPAHINKLQGLQTENEEKLKKAFLPRTKRKYEEEIVRIKREISSSKAAIKAREEYRDYLAKLGNFDVKEAEKKIQQIEEIVTKSVVKENKDLPEVSEKILKALQNEGVGPTYYYSRFGSTEPESKLAMMAEQFIYSEARKVIKKEDYEEKVNKVKANLESDDELENE